MSLPKKALCLAGIIALSWMWHLIRSSQQHLHCVADVAPP